MRGAVVTQYSSQSYFEDNILMKTEVAALPNQ